jgi:outer membrane receptor protein involved in Fe transport
VGLRGEVLRDWQYNAYVQYGQSDQTAYTTGNVSVSRFEALLYSPDGGQAECGGFNPFGYDSISKRCADYLAVELEARTKVSQASAEFTIKGRAYDLPAGAVETVFGIFYKRDEYRLRPDPLQFGLLPDGRPEVSGAMVGQGPVQGDDNNVDFFVEALVPILADRRGVRSLQATLGYRYSDYASFGGASSYKADLLYEPVNPVHFRGSFQHAIRAPSLIQLYNPQLQAFPGIDPPDPCSVGSPQRTGPDAAAVEALCIAQGIPPELMPLFDYQDPGIEGFDGGNPDLEPETANTYTFGIVLTSPFGWIAGSLSGMNRSLPFLLAILLYGIGGILTILIGRRAARAVEQIAQA